MVSVRRLLALVALVAAGVAAVWLLVDDHDGDGSGRAGAEGDAAVETASVKSRAVGEELDVSLVGPEDDSEGRPLLVFLHGRGGDERSCLSDAMFAALAELGDRAPALACPDGGDSFWHNRDTGEWGDYVVDEVIPFASRRLGTDPDRVAIGGISMGGFGAVNLARLEPGRFCGVGAHSPALWATAEETAPGAFDDAEAFAANDVLGAASDPRPFAAQPIRVDVGEEDAFLAGAKQFASTLEEGGVSVQLEVSPGGHDGAYWDAHWDDYLRFYARALEACG